MLLQNRIAPSAPQRISHQLTRASSTFAAPQPLFLLLRPLQPPCCVVLLVLVLLFVLPLSLPLHCQPRTRQPSQESRLCKCQGPNRMLAIPNLKAHGPKSPSAMRVVMFGSGNREPQARCCRTVHGFYLFVTCPPSLSYFPLASKPPARPAGNR